MELGSTGGETKGLGLGKADNSLKAVYYARQWELGEIGDVAGRLELGKAGNGGAGSGRAGNGGGGSGGVVNGGAGGSKEVDGKRGNIGALEKTSPSGLM